MFTMLNNKQEIILGLKRLGLTGDEAKVYLCLLEGPMTHLQIARKSGVNRTKIYRIADQLSKIGLISETVNEEGRELAAADPSNLEISLTTAEERLKAKRQVLKGALPVLHKIYRSSGTLSELDFAVNSYEGIDGFKQMLWNELKSKDEILIFGYGTIQDLIGSARWAEQHRAKTLEAGYKIREILNPKGKPENFTANEDFKTIYHKKYISPDILPLGHQMCIYNNTVSIYNWQNDQRVGTEILNKSFANMQRAVFENYWQLAK